MTHRDMPEPPEPDESLELSRRRFLQGGVAAATAGVLGLPRAAEPVSAKPRERRPGSFAGKRPNFLILMCDEMRFPPVYESAATKEFRFLYLKTQDFLRRNGL
ncbi:MAG: twin-arginine translocation signal domain-containing protein, partial [Methylococcaceae bacterium]|nr:twin-arginine translocation signal domain-containing protein [Methylococcaceae bacterium]